MKIGLVSEFKDRENRVGLAPDGDRGLVEDGHRAVVEQGAGLGSGFADDDSRRAVAEGLGSRPFMAAFPISSDGVGRGHIRAIRRHRVR